MPCVGNQHLQCCSRDVLCEWFLLKLFDILMGVFSFPSFPLNLQLTTKEPSNDSVKASAWESYKRSTFLLEEFDKELKVSRFSSV